MKPALFLLPLLLLAGCTGTASAPSPSGARLTPISFTSLPGWQSDKVSEARPALEASCARLLRLPANRPLGGGAQMGQAGDWQAFCNNLKVTPRDEGSLRALITSSLQPYAVDDGTSPEGLFTGYYESSLRGSLTQQGAYQYPLYRRPPELVMVDLGAFREELKGQRIAGYVESGNLKPFADRKAIVDGSLAGRGLELVWLDNAVDAFFVQIQGSGRVTLDDGRELRIGYDGQNGHIYTAIGRELVKRGAMKAEEVSMQTIRSWLEAHPAEASAVMNSNRSYVFFTPTQGNSEGPQGAANVALTPQRSLAVDNSFIGYHLPLWIALDNGLNRLVVAQDTGGAIRGVVRGDFFWGHGAAAEQNAGNMKAHGRYYVLLPVLRKS